VIGSRSFFIDKSLDLDTYTRRPVVILVHMNLARYAGTFVLELLNRLTLAFEDNSRFVRRVLLLYRRSTIIGSLFSRIVGFVALDSLRIHVYVAGGFTGVIFI